MSLKKSLLTALCLTAWTLSASAAQITGDFDLIVEDRSFVDDAISLSPGSPSHRGVSVGSHYGADRHTTDCRRVYFPANGSTVSTPIRLESRFYRERCRLDSENRRSCEEHYVGSERRAVVLEVRGRSAMLPWEEDEFRVCLSGHQLDVEAVEASHQYRFAMPDMHKDLIVAVAEKKIATLPDPNGIRLDSFSAAEDAFSAEFSDRWQRYYQGEELILSLIVRKDNRMWGDETVLEKQSRLATSVRHSIRLTKMDFRKPPESGKKYFLKWSFQRLGPTSKPTEMGDWQTVAIELGQSTSALKK